MSKERTPADESSTSQPDEATVEDTAASHEGGDGTEQHRSSPKWWPLSRPWTVRLVLLVLSVQFLTLGAIQARNDSFTYDEPYYLVSGQTALTEQDLRINYEHPPLPKLLAAIPGVLFADVDIPLDTSAWENADTTDLLNQVVSNNWDDIHKITFLFRIVPLLEAAAIGLILYLFGRDLFGWQAGLLSGGLWLTLPLAVGFGHLNGLDVPAALAVLGASYLLLRYLDRRKPLQLLWLGLAVGAALLTRAAVGLVVAASVIAVVAVADIWRFKWRGIAHTAGIALIGWGVVWLVYWILDPGGFDTTLARPEWLLTTPGAEPSFFAQIALLVPWPSSYSEGIRFLSDFHGATGSPGYLFGDAFNTLSWPFWPGSFLLKMTPVAIIAIIGGAVCWRRVGRRNVLRAAVVLGLPLLGLILMMSQAQRPFGVRYLIPIIVILLVVAGPFAMISRWNVRGWSAGLALLGLLAVAQLAMLWDSHPHSLSWSAPGFPPAWRVAADSNVDWGQDFYRLQEWAADKETPYVSYFGEGPSDTLMELPGTPISAHPYTIWWHGIEPPRDTEWIAVSASNLNAYAFEGASDYYLPVFTTLRAYCPVDIIGETILVYHFESLPQQLHLRDVPDMPAPLCPDEEYSQRVY
jgi:4-amino-4-deoxy-L-arabinose transferase-like glycosyltransferase